METASHPKRLWPVVLAGFVLIFLFAVAVKLLLTVNPAPPAEDAARAAERTKAHEELMAENALKLNNFAWVDKAKGQVQIPIAQAMELAAARLNARPPAPAGPIVPPPAAEAPAPAAEPSAPPAAQPAPAN